MATPLQRLCLRARSTRHTVSSCSSFRSLSQPRYFHDTRCKNRRLSEEEEAARPVKELMVDRKPKRKQLKPSDIDAPRATSTRQLLDMFDDEEVNKIIHEKEDNEYTRFLQQYAAAVSPEYPEGYKKYMEENNLNQEPKALKITNESQLNTAIRYNERIIEAQHREFRDMNPSEVLFEPQPEGFVSEKDEDARDFAEDETFNADDISSVGHGYLEQHREIREYYRLAAWELPLLTEYAKEFEPPSGDTPLRFRYTSYMGEKHPAEKKVVVEFCTADLPLTPKQRQKLVKIAGQRYNPQKDLIKMSCESFPEPQQNKRYLSDLVDSLLAEARLESTAEGGKDQFADIPADFRHVKWKKEPKFPDAWKMTPERREKLFQGWTAEIGRSQQAELTGNVVDGVKTISHFLGAKTVEAPEPVRVK